MPKPMLLLSAFPLLIPIFSSTIFHAPCNYTSDCQELFNSHYICQDSICAHEPLWPFDLRREMGAVLIIFVSALANAGGIGGGAIIVPLYLYVFYYTVGEAIPLSKATILAGAVVNIFLIIRRRRPSDQNQLLIDFKVASIIVPLILSGTMIGVALTKMLPPVIILSVLLYYISTTITSMYQKAKSLYAKETEERQKREAAKVFELSVATQSTTEKSDKGQNESEQSMLSTEGKQDRELASPKEALADKSKSFCELIWAERVSLGLCLLSYLNVLTVTLLRGGKGLDSVIGLESCSAKSWALLLLSQTASLLIGFYGVLRVRESEEAGFSEEQIDQSNREKRSLLAKSYFAGILAGSLGMGGGVVINPVLIKMGYPPEVAAALSGFVVLFTSSSTTSQFLVAGAFDFSNAAVILLLSALGSFLGSFYVNKVIARYNRPSLLVWILFGLILLSGLALGPIGFMQVISQPHMFQFNTPC